MARINSGVTSSAPARLRVWANNSRRHGLRDQACAGMWLISMRSSLYAASFWNTLGQPIGMRKPSAPHNHQNFDMHPLIGHIQSEHIEELKAQMQGNESGIVLDLSEVT